MNNEDFKTLYELGKLVLAEETARNSRLDEKSSRVLSALTVVITIYAFYAQWILQRTPPKQLLEFLILFAAGFALLTLVLAWHHAFAVLKIDEYAKLPFSDQLFNLHQTLPTDQFLFSLSKTIQTSVRFNRSLGDQKVLALTNAFRMIHATGFLFFLLLILVLVHTFVNPSPGALGK